MTKPKRKAKTATSIKVVLDIKPTPASPAQKAAWKRLWDKLLSEVKADEPEGSGGQ